MFGSSFTGSGTHGHKPILKRVKLEEDGDMISNLPEVLISRILSILPTKDAVRTSVLSKKWNHRWTLITNLNLDDSFYFSPKKKVGGKLHFMNFVYRALLLAKSPTVDSFTLSIGHNNNKYDVSLVNTWISNVLNRSLKKLSINSHMELRFSPLTTLSLLDSKLLEELVLNMHCFASIKVPTNYVSLRCLKSLKLVGIRFTLDYKYSKDLTFGFPVLQNFEVVSCTWLHATRVTFNVPLLETFSLKQEAKSAAYQPNNYPINVSAPHLKQFIYCAYGFISQCITLVDPLSPQSAFASITLWKCDERDTLTGQRAFLLLKQLSRVNYLKFEGSEVLPQSTGLTLPSFGMLKHLELGLVAGEILLGLLLKSPVLKTLILKGLKSKFDKELFSSADVPECLQHTLEVVKFGEVHGLEHELWLAKFVMENGLVLKRMSFSVPAWLGNSIAIEEFKEKLFTFKKGFGFAFVEFSYHQG